MPPRTTEAQLRDADFATIDSIITAMYESISGPKGTPGQWERDRALHHPKALLIPALQAPGGPAAGVFDFDGFVDSRARFLEDSDFYEVEIGRQEFRFGVIAHVLSSYEARTAPAPAGKLLRRGVNSIQLMHDGERWWILSTLWDNEREGVELPANLL
jgi:hypothetical protein